MLPLYDYKSIRYFPCGERKKFISNMTTVYSVTKSHKLSAAYSNMLACDSEICDSCEPTDLGWAWLEEVGSALHTSHPPGDQQARLSMFLG